MSTLRELAARAGAAIRAHAPAIAEGLQSGAGSLEFARDLACTAAEKGRGAALVLAEAGVVKKRTAKAAAKACHGVEVAGQVAAVVADGARGLAGAVERGQARRVAGGGR